MRKILVVAVILLMVASSGCSNEKNISKEAELESYINSKDNKQKKDKIIINNSIASKEEVLTAADCYIYSFESDYISQDNKLSYLPILITTEEQLEFAEDRYGLYIPDNEKVQYGNISIASAFQEMKKQYPLSDYWYLIQYDEFSCGGYYYHADKVVINDDIIRFEYDEKRSPDEEQVTEVMCGFCHMAAIKKEKLEGKVFTNVIYPDKNDMSQNLNFSYHTSMNHLKYRTVSMRMFFRECRCKNVGVAGYAEAFTSVLSGKQTSET